MTTATTTTGPQRRRHAAAPVDPRAKAEARTRRYHRGSVTLDAMAFILPVTMSYQVEIIGRLYAAEFIMLLCLPLLLIDRGPMLMEALPKAILTLAAAWFASQIVTDIVDATPYADYSRGWSRIFFFVTNFAVIYMVVYGNRRRLILFALGLAIGLLVASVRYPSEGLETNPWKSAYGMAITLAIVASLQFRFLHKTPLLPVLIMFAVGGLNMYMGWRSMAGVCFLGAMYLIAQMVFGKKGANVTPPTNTRLVIISILGMGAIWLVLTAYEIAAMDGLLGEDAKEKLIDQTSSGEGVLLGGRHEILVSIQAIADSPILGHGSWARDRKYVDMLNAMGRSADEQIEAAWFGDLIPTHSHLTGSWVEAGLMGGLFWIFVLFLVARVMANLFQIRDPISPLMTFIAILMTWDILFSPFGAERRIVVPYEIVLMIFMWESLKNHAQHAKQIRRIRRAAKKALSGPGGGRLVGRGGPRPMRPLPNPRLMRRPPANVATLPRPSARVAQRAEETGESGQATSAPDSSGDGSGAADNGRRDP